MIDLTIFVLILLLLCMVNLWGNSGTECRTRCLLSSPSPPSNFLYISILITYTTTTTSTLSIPLLPNQLNAMVPNLTLFPDLCSMTRRTNSLVYVESVRGMWLFILYGFLLIILRKHNYIPDKSWVKDEVPKPNPPHPCQYGTHHLISGCPC